MDNFNKQIQELLNEAGLSSSRAYLFGSRLLGTGTDIDLAIRSNRPEIVTNNLVHRSDVYRVSVDNYKKPLAQSKDRKDRFDILVLSTDYAEQEFINFNKDRIKSIQ